MSEFKIHVEWESGYILDDVVEEGIMWGVFDHLRGLRGLIGIGDPVIHVTISMSPGPYVVGEVGPELFVPTKDGYVVPNSEIKREDDE